MNDALLTPDIAAAASTAAAATPSSFRLLPLLHPGGEGDGEVEGEGVGLLAVTDRGVAADGSRGRSHLSSPPPSSPPLLPSAPLSQSASRRPERGAAKLKGGEAKSGRF